MNFEAQKISLQRLWEQINSRRLATQTNPVSTHTRDWDALNADIQRWEGQVQLIQRNLKSQAHFAAMLHQVAGGSRAPAPAQHSHTSKLSNQAELYKRVGLIAHELTHLTQQRGGTDQKKALDAIGSALENLTSGQKQTEEVLKAFSFGNQQAQISASVRQVTASTPVPPGGLPPGGVVDLFTLILAYFALLKAMSSKKT